MKNLIFTIIFSIIGFMAFGQGGVNFENLTFSEALAKAKAEKKLVFVDCFTEWCGPCNYMTENVFKQEKAGEFFKPRFVAIKIDMEKGEGGEIARKFGIRAFPTFLIIRPDGTLQHKIVGGEELDYLIVKLEKGVNEKTSLGYLDKVYERGRMSKKQLMLYKVVLDEAYEEAKSKKVTKELNRVLEEKDKMRKEYWPILESRRYGSADFKLVRDHIATFNKNIGKDIIDSYLLTNYSAAIRNTLALDSVEALETLKQIQGELGELDFGGIDELRYKIELNRACLNREVDKVIAWAEEVNTNENGELWPVMDALVFIKEEATTEELNRIIKLENRYLDLVPDESRKDIIDFFKSLKIAVYPGIYFQDFSYEEALLHAREEGRILFIDCYTSWCVPCQYMARTVFKQKDVSDFMNKDFICVKYDMEKGEGPELAKKLGVTSFPTFILVNPDGTIRHKLVGSVESDGFIEWVKEGLDDTKAFGTLITKYNDGNRDKAFLVSYIGQLMNFYDPAATEVANELFKVLDDKERVKPSYWFIFGNRKLSPKDSESAKYLIDNRDRFNAGIGKNKVDDCLSENLLAEIMAVVSGNGQKIDNQRLDAIEQEIKELKLYNEKMMLSALAMAKAVKTGDIDKILSVAAKEIPNLGKGYNKRMLIHYLSGLLTEANDIQKAKWEEIKGVNSDN